MPLTLNPQTNTIDLPTRLGGLLVRFRMILLVRGGSQILLVALLLTGLFGYLDWRYQLPSFVRALALTAILAVPSLVVLRVLIHPWQRERTLLAMAHRVERRFPECNDALTSAVQFLETSSDHQAGSALLRESSIQFAMLIADEIELNRAVPLQGLRRSLAALILALAGVGYLLTSAPAAVECSLARLAFPFRGMQWPAKTTIELQSPLPIPYQAVFRESFEVRAIIRGMIPERAVVTFKEAAGRPFEQGYTFSRSEQTAGEALLVVRVESDRVERPFQFRIRANDSDTGWLPVEIHTLPTLVPRDGRPSPQINLNYPNYTGLRSTQLPDGGSIIETITGTHVQIRAAADRPLARATFVARPTPSGWLAGAMLTAMSVRSGPEAAASYLLGREIWDEIPVAVYGDGRWIDIDFVPRFSGTYTLSMHDESGFRAERTFDVRVDVDPSPQVIVLKPGDPNNLQLTPDAAFEIIALTTDEKFALRRVALEYRTSSTQTARRTDWYDAATTAAILPPLSRLMALPLQAPPSPVLERRACGFHQLLSLREFTHPDGRPLTIGDVFSFRIVADDFDNVTWNKPVGSSDWINIAVVSSAQIDANLQASLVQIRQDILFLRDLQWQARQKVLDSLKELGSSNPPTRKTTERLLHTQSLQLQLRTKLIAPDDGTLARLARMRQTILDNRLTRSRITQQVDLASAELDRLAREELGPIENTLGQVQKQNNPDAATTSLHNAERAQLGVIETLRALLERLQPWSGAAEVRGEARVLLNDLRKQVQRLTEMERRMPFGQTGGKRDELPETIRSELDKLAPQAEQATDQIRKLLEKLNQLGEEKERAFRDGGPHSEDTKEALRAEIEAIRQAAANANGPALRQRLPGVPEQIRQNQLSDARDRLRQSAEQIEKLIATLEDKHRAEPPDRLMKRARETSASVEKLIDDQDRLLKKIAAASDIADPAARTAEFAKLAREQQILQEQAEEIVKQLIRQGDDRTAHEVRRAARQMENSRRQLEQGQPPPKNNNESLDHLDDALDELERQRTQAQDELLREQLAQASELLKAIRDRQQAAVDEGSRLFAKVLDKQGWDAAIARNALPDLISQQRALAKELQALIARQFHAEPVFARMLRQSAEAMESAAARLDDRKEDVLDQLEGIAAFDRELEIRAAQAIHVQQALALKRLDQLLEVMKPDPEAQRLKAKNPKKKAEKADNPPKNESPDPLPSLAQLKALRLLQAEITERTAAFHKAHPERVKLTPEEIAEIDSLHRAQLDIGELVQKLTPAGETP